MKTKKHYEIVYASDFPEFFYTEDDCVVSEHQPIGVDIWEDSAFEDFASSPIEEVKFKLFDGIYWSPQFAEDIE